MKWSEYGDVKDLSPYLQWVLKNRKATFHELVSQLANHGFTDITFDPPIVNMRRCIDFANPEASKGIGESVELLADGHWNTTQCSMENIEALRPFLKEFSALTKPNQTKLQSKTRRKILHINREIDNLRKYKAKLIHPY